MDRQDLRTRIEQKYQTTNQQITIPTGLLEMTVVEDSGLLLNQLKSTKLLTFPYWATIWQAGIGLAHHLATVGNFSGLSVLDLGCGMGLAGIAACQQGSRLCFSDWIADALLFAQYNTLRNGYDGTFVQMDWSFSCLGHKFSAILASDVIYERQNWEPMLSFVKAHLVFGGRVFFSEPARKNANDFPDYLIDRGFQLSRYCYPVEVDGRLSKISIYEARYM